MKHFVLILATGFYTGYAPKAPGTWGSLPGLGLGAALHYLLLGWFGSMPSAHDVLSLSGIGIGFAMLAALTLGSVWVVSKVQDIWQTHDDGRIVLDEILGQALAIFAFAPSPTTVTLGFIAFRVFDILKPGPIGWADRRISGAWGVICDDLLAGLAAGSVVAIAVFMLI